ncbi:NAD(P)-binding protein [Neolentinus lepideus HHB14362 ss-1]|uniref:NAD(P)-binding protein n=1 Tax=Neolentinus lepideus HHB14362 ss-1 TaxID=1314782 RepID=A0A165NJX6_9AGAM|nr:NAD(P)-binding protein [Neolentinus lepideus HHB14362 ss-1]
MAARRITIVTGAAQAIGRAIALRLARDGLAVAISDLSSKRSALEDVAKDIQDSGGHTMTVEANVDDLATTVVDKLGGLDVYVSPTSLYPLPNITPVSMAEFDNIQSVNTRGLLMCYTAATRIMIEQKRGGRIIGASSVSGKKGFAGTGAYSASKFAVRALTQAAACELGYYSITVNAYATGVIDTPLGKEFVLGYCFQLDDTSQIQYQLTSCSRSFTAQSALGRMGHPDDIANIVSFLASKDSGHITGQTIAVDGGLWFD